MALCLFFPMTLTACGAPPPAPGLDAGPHVTARVHHTFTGHSEPTRQIAFSPDGQLLATSSVDRTVKLWRVPDGTLAQTLTHPEGITSVAFSPDGRWLVSGSYDRTVKIWRLQDGTLARTLAGHVGTVWSVDVSPDGQRVASSGEDKTIRLWRLSDGVPLQTLTGHTLNVWAVRFSPDGQRLGSGSFDHTVKLWRADTGALLQTLTGHTQAVVSIAFSPAGEWLASGGREKGALGTLWKQIAGDRLRGARSATIRLWRVRDGALQQALADHADDVTSVAFSPDGKWLASGSDDKP